MEVENVSAPGSCVYFPYGITEIPESAALTESHLARDPGVWEHSFSFFPVSVGSETYVFADSDIREQVYNYYSSRWSSAIFTQAEQDSYRNFVYQHELQIPENFQETLQPWLQESGMAEILQSMETFQNLIRWEFSQEQLDSIFVYDPLLGTYQYHFPDVSNLNERTGWRVEYAVTLIPAVIYRLHATTSYDLYAPAVPSGEDYVAWFLNEQKTGCCMHYATAATLLLRMLGVPARYVSGYVVNIPDSGFAAVPDRQAHAWIEVYLDGLGWYPVEVTPGFQGQEMGAFEQEQEGEDETVSSSPTPAPTASETSLPSPTPTASSEVSFTPTSQPEEQQTSQQDASKRDSSFGWTLLFGMVSLCILTVAGWYLVRRRRRRRLHSENVKTAVLYALKCHRRFERWGCAPDETLTALAEKAKFSNHTLTEEEREQALQILVQHREAVLRDLPIWKRWFASLIL